MVATLRSSVCLKLILAGLLCGYVFGLVDDRAFARDNEPTAGDAPCTYLGVVYVHGETITVGGNDYTCENGVWKKNLIAITSGGVLSTGGGRTIPSRVQHTPISTFERAP